MTLLYLDDAYLAENEAKISVLNRGFLMGDGLYATLQVCEGKPLFLSLHLERLKKQAEMLSLKCPPINAQIIDELIKRNEAYTGIWKLKIVITADDEAEMSLPKRHFKHLIITLHPYLHHSEEPLKVTLYPEPIMSPHAHFKSLAHLSRYYVMQYAKQRGLDDALTQTERGILLESAFGNIFWIADKVLFTSDPALPLHFGMTITQMIEIAQNLGFSVMLVKSNLEEIPQEASLFRVNTMGGLRAIVSVDEREFARNIALEQLLRSHYEERAGIKRAVV